MFNKTSQFKKVEVVEVTYFPSITGSTQRDHIRNSDICGELGRQYETVVQNICISIGKKRVQRVKRMNDNRIPLKRLNT